MELAAKDLIKSLLVLLKQAEEKEGSRATALLSSGEYNGVVPVHNLWDVRSPSHVTHNAAGM